MAKRFTDSSKWNDNWFSNLTNEQKLTWIYILDTCDHSGIWEKNLKVLNFHIGSTFVEGELQEIFSGKFIEINDKWFIPKFIKFQYGDKFLTSTNNAIVSARKLLIEVGFLIENTNGSLTLTQGSSNPQLTLTQPSPNPQEGLKEQEEEQEQDKFQLKEREREQLEEQDKVKLKGELGIKLKSLFKTIPNIIKLVDTNDLDKVERMDKYLFNLHYSTIVEYQSIKIK
jgi:hypothetical protein